ncbi:outer membrane lipoprotein chaperone LolA [Longimicrobium sp.]|uniref:outer membrane lipoprotein chaperone LolA n=1 Tax=Longimicrobium sp. TaxID=2029185 RepID=UPI002E323791|nr:outer membrane lipoprotein chaperone LolA [Longimicrobium sp.]HEX6042566.1 outer membrane lipoprotein chaperone LolA [Longimicrobium sp.]
MMKTSTRLGWVLLSLPLAACGGRESSAAAPGDHAERPPAAQAAPVAGQPAQAPAATQAPGAVPVAGTAPAQPGAPTAPGTAAAPSAPAPVGDAKTQDRAAQILTLAETAARNVRSLEADFTQTLTIPLLNQSQNSAGKLYQRKPDRFLMQFSDPAGDVIVADGQHFWLYYPSSDRTQVIRTSIAQGGEAVDLQAQFLSNPNQRFVATVAGQESVGGRPADVLTLVPRGASPYKILKIWVDREDHLVRRFEMTEENDSVRRVELRNLRTNHALADNLFTFTPPAGAQVFDQ